MHFHSDDPATLQYIANVATRAAVDGHALRLDVDADGTLQIQRGHSKWAVLAGQPDPTQQHANYPHEPGRLYDCPACEARCHCDPDPGTTACVFEGTHRYQKD